MNINHLKNEMMNNNILLKINQSEKLTNECKKKDRNDLP